MFILLNTVEIIILNFMLLYDKKCYVSLTSQLSTVGSGISVSQALPIQLSSLYRPAVFGKLNSNFNVTVFLFCEFHKYIFSSEKI